MKKLKLHLIVAVIVIISLITVGCLPGVTRFSSSSLYGSISNSLTPSANCTYDLGSPTLMWQNLYLCGNVTASGGYINGVSVASLGTGNVTTSGGTAGKVPYFTTNKNIENSIVTANATAINVAGTVQSTSEMVTGNITTTGNITMSAGMLVDGVDVSGHAGRHQWGGADEPNIRDSLMGQSPYITLDCNNTGWGQVLTGSSTSSVANTYWDLNTGVTANSTAGRVGVAVVCAYSLPGYRWRWYATTLLNPVDMVDVWVGMVPVDASYPITTSNHAAFHIYSTGVAVSAKLYASNGDGVNGTATDTGYTMVAGTNIGLYIKYQVDNIKYYYSTDGGLSWILGATHTTNRPDFVYVLIGSWVKNLNAVAKQLNFKMPRLMEGTE